MNLIKSGTSPNDVQKLLHKEDWQMRNYISNSEKYTKAEIKKAIVRLCDYDYKLKSGLLDKSIILELITLEFCE